MTISRAQFEKEGGRRFGTANPDRMRVAHWEWMIRHRADPFQVRESLGLLTKVGGHPYWCFDRLGMTRTRMPDGRIICIAGEHEDWYDPDFCIYNDVIVLRPEPGQADVSAERGEVEIYGYPETLFPLLRILHRRQFQRPRCLRRVLHRHPPVPRLHPLPHPVMSRPTPAASRSGKRNGDAARS